MAKIKQVELRMAAISTALFTIVLIFSFVILLKNKENNLSDNFKINRQSEKGRIILYYGSGCPHCAVVENYIKSNNIKEKLSFKEKEIYHNRENADELVEKAKICGIPAEYIGVPFLWDGEKCYIGDQDIIDFFKRKLK